MAIAKKRNGPPKSAIGVANHDIDTAIDATRQFRNVGLDRPTVAQASELLEEAGIGHKNTVKNKIYTAAKYMLLELRLNPETHLQEVFLPPLGVDVLDPAYARSAKAQAFLNVELNRTLYARYFNRPLPSDVELDRILVNELGVVVKQRQHVRRTFTRSALQAGFFEQGRDRLTLPSDVSLPADLLAILDDLRTKREMEDTAMRHEDVSPTPDIEMAGVPTSTTAQLPMLPSGKPVAPVPPASTDRATETIERPAGPNPAVIAWWWQKKPRQDAPKAHWVDWQKALDVILALEFPNERAE